MRVGILIFLLCVPLGAVAGDQVRQADDRQYGDRWRQAWPECVQLD